MKNLRLILIAVAVAWCAGYARWVALPAARAQTHGFAAYYAAAHLLAHTAEKMDQVYEDDWFAVQIARAGVHGVYDVFNVQPPTMSLLLLPLTSLPSGGARVVWTLLSLCSLLVGLILLARALDLPPRWGLWVLPLCLLYAPIAENLRDGQAYLALFGLFCLLFSALLRDRGIIAGMTLGLMLALKTAALWLWPLLLLGGRWRALAWAAVTAAGVALVSLPRIGLGAWRAYVSLLPQLAATPKLTVTAYQTTASLTGHLLIHDDRWNPTSLADLPLLARALNLALLVVALALSARWGRLSDERREVRALTLALFSSLLVTNAPLAEGHHYNLLLPALMVAFWWAWQAGLDWRGWVWLASAAFLLGAPLPYQSPRLAAGGWALLAYPRVYGAYLLWGWLGWGLATVDSRQPTAGNKPFGRIKYA